MDSSQWINGMQQEGQYLAVTIACFEGVCHGWLRRKRGGQHQEKACDEVPVRIDQKRGVIVVNRNQKRLRFDTQPFSKLI
ncbi:hypothetical protein [Roseibium aggregatum]|uniref:hypothetical protein n=1 Tax=Roseibium aggregatum TaxID=187304 RepID=UPI003A982214